MDVRSLRENIAKELKESPWESKDFLPNDRFEELINKKAIEEVTTIRPREAFNDSIKVIATLLYINELDAFPKAREEGLTDKYLPVKLDPGNEVLVFRGKPDQTGVRPEKFFRPFSSGTAVYKDFFRDQWLFQAPTFNGQDLGELHDRCPLPLLYKSKQTWGGGFGDVWQVKVHHAHLALDSEPTENDNPMLALKKLRSDSYDDYEQEQKALFKIQKLRHPHLIEVIASFQIGQGYFFLFPWADDGHLTKLWETKSKEFRKIKMIRWAFEQMKGLASGVRTLHHPVEGLSEENGRHGDLRPENILIFVDKVAEREAGANSDNKPRSLRITDAGLAKFHTEITSKRLTGTVTTGGYKEYAPPEALEKGVRSRKYDMWSLGCIFLEFAIWLLSGYDEIGNFRQARISGGSDDAEYFFKDKSRHMGKVTVRLLPEVKNFIRKARNHGRCQGDTCFQDLFDVIENGLLQVNLADRYDAEALDARLGKIVENMHKSVAYCFTSPDPKGFNPQPLPHKGAKGPEKDHKRRWKNWF